ncbi:Oidioi.mRNA.OKI2018_I69.XSR.g15050.t1.cds [Oikopleura dioica]|uniref:Oidioi.mRNA.OKI2018_I69.XSR.g15050.t1.cds n=1 Tax=Oikopleura dioica TaxID=34765 RepID=A0ABN7SGN1_OIKDI|nr:Oidioi.mRNA.OKI2018_I69.XSR.g15050.t1.cds [Oikopleura dioica]
MFSYEGALARLEWAQEVNSLWLRGLLQPENLLHSDYLQTLKTLLGRNQFEKDSERSLQRHLEVTFSFLPYPVIRSLTKKLIQKKVKRAGKERGDDLDRFQLFPTINITTLIGCLEKFKNIRLRRAASLIKQPPIKPNGSLFGLCDVGAGLFLLKIGKKRFLYSESRPFGPCPCLRSSSIFATEGYILDVFKEKIHVFFRRDEQIASVWEVPLGWLIHRVVKTAATDVVYVLILRDGVRRTMTFDLASEIRLDKHSPMSSSTLSWVLKESEKIKLRTRYDFHEDSSDHLYDSVDILCNSKTLPFSGNAINLDEIRIDGANIAISHRKSGEMHKFITVLSTSGDDVLLSGEFNLEAIERLELPSDAQVTWSLNEMELLFKFVWCTGRKLCTAHARPVAKFALQNNSPLNFEILTTRVQAESEERLENSFERGDSHLIRKGEEKRLLKSEEDN